MKEKDLERDCMAELAARLPKAYVWKIHDEVTAGQPDLEVAWRGNTTKLEFKLLRKNETVHDKWEDRRQLITCLRYEQQTSRCWVVAFQRRYTAAERLWDNTLIYRPSALLDGKLPEPKEWFLDVGPANLPVLWEAGVVGLRSFNYKGIAHLIELTHL